MRKYHVHMLFVLVFFIVFKGAVVSANSFGLSVLQNICFERFCLQMLHCCTAVFCR